MRPKLILTDLDGTLLREDKSLSPVNRAALERAAAQGAEATKQYVSKFGRAKSYGTKTIGTPDAGAVSMSWFFQGLARE